MRNLLFAAMLTLSLSAVAQADYVYEPLFKEGRVWKCERVYHETGNEYYPKTDYYDYTIHGDTVIADMLYYKVYMKSEFTFEDTDWHYYSAVRENLEEEKCYVLYDGTDEEQVLYDFSIPIRGKYTIINGQEVILCEELGEIVLGKNKFDVIQSYKAEDSKGKAHKVLSLENRIFRGQYFALISGFGLCFPSFQMLYDPFNIDAWSKQYRPEKMASFYSVYLARCYYCYDYNELHYNYNDELGFIFIQPTESGVDIQESQVKDGLLYDLSGRVAIENTRNGVCLKKGKKFLKK